MCKQLSTQDELAFMEDVRSAADKGDIAGGLLQLFQI